MINQIFTPERIISDKPAILSSHLHLTYAEFYRSVAGIAAHLQPLLPRQKGIVAIRTGKIVYDWLITLALRALGYTTATFNNLSILNKMKLQGVCAICHDGLSAEETELLSLYFAELPALSLPFENLANVSLIPAPDEFGSGPFGGHVEYTSGSTGINKAILRPGPITPLRCERAAMEYFITPDTVFHLNMVTPATSVGGKVPLSCWALGATCIFDHRPDRLALLNEHQPTRLFLPPDSLQRLTLTKCHHPANPNLMIFCGGGFLSASVARKIKTDLNCRLFMAYGGTEFGMRMRTEFRTDEDTIWLDPLPEYGCEIVDDEDEPVRVGEEGYLRLRSAEDDPDQYLGDTATTSKHFRNGHYYSGDLAIERPDGRIRIIGRTADVLNLGGQKHAVGPYETMACDLLSVSGTCMFVRQTENAEDFIGIVAETNQEISEAWAHELTAKLCSIFPQKDYHFLFFRLRNFPRLEAGGMFKVSRQAVIEMALLREPTLSVRHSLARSTD